MILQKKASRYLLLIKIIIAGVILTLLLKLIKFGKLAKLLESKRVKYKGKDKINELIELVDKVSRARFFLIRKNCYKKCLLLYYFLNKTDCENLVLAIGISKINGKLQGHSWVIFNNQLLLDDKEFIKNYKIMHTLRR